MIGGKVLSFSEDPIGLDSEVTYIDQKGSSVNINMNKFYQLAKKSKDPYFDNWLDWLKNKELTIGAFIITGIDKLAKEFPNKIESIIVK